MGASADGTLVVVVGDPGERLETPPITVQLSAGSDTASATLLDDGQPPDAVAGDQVYTAAVEGYPRGEVLATLTDAEGRSLWSDTVPIEGSLGTPRISAILTDTYVRIEFDTVGGEIEPFPDEVIDPAAGFKQPAPGPEPEPMHLQMERDMEQLQMERDMDMSSRSRRDMDMSSRSRSGGSQPGALLLAGLVGFLIAVVAAVTYRLVRRSRPVTQPVGKPLPAPSLAGVPALLGERQVWAVPDPEALHVLVGVLARGVSGSAAVMLVPATTRRAEHLAAMVGVANVHWMVEDQPEVQQVLRAAKQLGPVAEVLVLVEGLDALEEPLDDEEPDAVLQELLDDAPRELGVLVLHADKEVELATKAVLVASERGLETQDGVLLLAVDPDGGSSLVLDG